MGPALEQSTNVPTRTCTAIETLEFNTTGDHADTAICVTSKTSHGNYNKQNVFVMSLLHVVHKDFVGVVHGWVLKFLETEQ